MRERVYRFRQFMVAAIMIVCGLTVLSACQKDDNQDRVTAISDAVWAYSQANPDGFTLDIRSMTVPKEGIAVSYAATQGSHSRDKLDFVVRHALQHDGYVGGWQNPENGLYYFDSTRLFPEDKLADALKFGRDNGQYSAFVLSLFADVPVNGKIAEIVERGTLLVGTTGDYRPLSFCEPETGKYWGFGIEMAEEIARRLGVETSFVKTANGKTILCRANDSDKYKSLEDINRPEVTVMVNPGGLNEKFANENLPNATIVVHEKNEEIPSLIAEGQADVMITEITEAPYYVKNDSRLAAPLLDNPFTHGEIGVLMRKGQDDLLQMVNAIIGQMKSDGSLRRLHEKYGLSYGF